MTEHIINFAIGIDDDAIVKNITEGAGKQVMADLECKILNSIFDARYYHNSVAQVRYDGKIELDSDATLKDWIADLIKNIVEENKDKIFELATDKLVESYKNTKKWKELVAEKLEGAEKHIIKGSDNNT